MDSGTILLWVLVGLVFQGVVVLMVYRQTSLYFKLHHDKTLGQTGNKAQPEAVVLQKNIAELHAALLKIKMVADQVTALDANVEFAFKSSQELYAASQQAASVLPVVLANGLDGSPNVQAKESGSSIAALQQHTHPVTEIAAVVELIAAQTHVLAMNAAVEAARAGEEGRGFALVADEIRVLAERTKESTQKIASMAGVIEKTTQNAVNAMQQDARLQPASQCLNGSGNAIALQQILQTIEQHAKATKLATEQIAFVLAKQEELLQTNAQALHEFSKTEN